MDRKVTVKFWQMHPAPVDGVDFAASLDAAFAKSADQAWLELDGATYQLTPQGQTNDVYVGDVIRLQSEALPSRLKRGEKAQRLTLADGEYLGHHTGFIYDRSVQLLGFEVKAAAAGLAKLTTLIAQLAKHAPCEALPVLNQKDMNSLAGTKNGVISFKIADPASLNTIDPDLATVRDNLVFLKEMVDGAYIHVAVGAGPRKEGLADNKLLKIVGWLLGERDSKRGKVRSVKVRQPHEAEPILDFLKAQFSDNDVLQLTGDPEEDWLLREGLLRKALAKAKNHVGNI